MPFDFGDAVVLTMVGLFVFCIMFIHHSVAVSSSRPVSIRDTTQSHMSSLSVKSFGPDGFADLSLHIEMQIATL